MGKGLRTLEFSFEDTDLTHFGGMVLMQRFCQCLRLRWLLERDVTIPHRGGDFQPADLLSAMLYVLIAGLRRGTRTEVLQYNGQLLSRLRQDRFPHTSRCRPFVAAQQPT